MARRLALAGSPDDDPGKKAFDSLELGGGDDYSPHKFYTKSTNGYDHTSEKIQTPFPPAIHAAIHQIVNSKIIPEYRGSAQAFIRDAVRHRIKQLEDLGYLTDPKMIRVWVEDDLTCRQAQLKERMEARRRLISEAEQTYKLCDAENDWGALGELLDLHEENVEELPEPYRGQLEKLIADYRRRLK